MRPLLNQLVLLDPLLEPILPDLLEPCIQEKPDSSYPELLSELLRDAIALDVLSETDLNSTEPQVIAKLNADERTAAAWQRFRAYRSMRRADAPEDGGQWRRIPAKKRYIDPLIEGIGRVSAYSEAFAAAVKTFLSDPQTDWIAGE